MKTETETPEQARERRLNAAAALRDAAHKLTLHVQETVKAVRELATLYQEATAMAYGRPDDAVRVLSKAHTAEYELTGDCAVVAELTERLGLTELFEAHEDALFDEVLDVPPGEESSVFENDAKTTLTLICLSCDHSRTGNLNDQTTPCPKCGSTSNAASAQ